MKPSFFIISQIILFFQQISANYGYYDDSHGISCSSSFEQEYIICSEGAEEDLGKKWKWQQDQQGSSLEISDFFFQPASRNLKLTELFSTSNIKLRKLTLWLDAHIDPNFHADGLKVEPHNWPKITHILNRLLNSSQHTLTSLVLHEPIGFLPGLEIPRMDKLKYLDLTLLRSVSYYTSLSVLKGDISVFPRSFNFLYNFPHLEQVRIIIEELPKKDYSPWTNFFPSMHTGPAVSVQHLNIYPYPIGTDDLVQLFPSVTHLVLRKWSNFPVLATNAWKWESLVYLQLNVNVRRLGNRFPSLDATFTGFDQADVKKIYNVIKTGNFDSKDISDKELMRTRSIADLEDLREVHLQFEDTKGLTHFYAGYEEEKQVYPELTDKTLLLTEVTGEFLLKYMPQLSVIISVSERREGLGLGPHDNNANKWNFETQIETALGSILEYPNFIFVRSRPPDDDSEREPHEEL